MKNKLNITETQVFGFEASFRGMRNPKNLKIVVVQCTNY